MLDIVQYFYIVTHPQDKIAEITPCTVASFSISSKNVTRQLT